ncbi:hypothetical protein AOLI_G00120160 [Acnodon oligacanthus]
MMFERPETLLDPSHRNVAVRRCTALTLQKLAELMGAPRILTSKTDLPKRFLVSISQLAVDSAPDVRFHARNVLRLLSTHQDFIKIYPEDILCSNNQVSPW